MFSKTNVIPAAMHLNLLPLGSCIPDSIKGTLSQMTDLSLLKDPVFLLIGIANVFGMLGFYTPYVYLPGAAIEKVRI